MKENIPRLTRTDNPDRDCLVFRNEADNLDFRLFAVAEYVLYDEKGKPVDVLPWPSTLGLKHIVAGYKCVNHKVADAVREFLKPKPQYPISVESAVRY